MKLRIKFKPRFKLKVRVLPAAMFAMVLLVTFKGISMAEGDAVDTAKEFADTAPASGTPEKKEEKKEEGGHGAEAKEGGHGEGEQKDAKEADTTIRVYQERPQEQESLKYTGAERDLLTKLADRRKELDKFQDDLDIKANLLESSSKKLDEKLTKLEQLKAATEKLLATYQQQEDVKIKSLVKIYESMKPKQAAAIFEKMDMNILLEIIDKMSEKKASLVLAQMNPTKANEITENLANQRSLASGMGVEPNAIDKIAN